MSDTFNPLTDGQWDASRKADILNDFAITIVSVEPMMAIVSLACEDGVRRDIMLGQQDASEMADLLTGFAEMTKAHPQLQAELSSLDDLVPYRN